ncbi:MULTISPECIES: DUF2960 family protein [Corallincola]|uniref:DUF2960 family protein n=3 Tax=Corallincola TaxID=1775176 RepID=A0A368N4H8_9GAMM|nr:MULTISPECIES: DUF2960 family protein [Corallincola]RCU45432.1 DUF2960 family protein [Corallincola holothuriorum]TAA41058.1 DUF2960 family protein [Corallincola spongiicola]TCI02710.1 DUF2960 family protein [Corallincola luteus]
MARQVKYKFKKQSKVIPFAFDKFNDPHEAVAAAEGIDISAFLAMEQQVAATTKEKSAIKDFRIKSFAKWGITDVGFVRDEES